MKKDLIANSILFTIVPFALGIVFFSIQPFSEDAFAQYQDDPYTATLKADVEFASPILQSGILSTGSEDYIMSNIFDIKHIRAGDLMRISGLTIEGHPFYAIHKYDFGEVKLSGKIMIDNNFVSLSQSTTPITVTKEIVEEETLELEPVKAVLIYPHSTYWRDTMTFSIKTFEQHSNFLNDYWYKENLVSNVPIFLDINHENGKHLVTFEGETDENGFFRGTYYVIDNLDLAGKYNVHLEAGNDIQDFNIFIIGHALGTGNRTGT